MKVNIKSTAILLFALGLESSLASRGTRNSGAVDDTTDNLQQALNIISTAKNFPNGNTGRSLSYWDDPEKYCKSFKYFLSGLDQVDVPRTLTLTGPSFTWAVPGDQVLFTLPLYKSRQAYETNPEAPLGFAHGQYMVIPGGLLGFGCILNDRYTLASVGGDFNVQFTCDPTTGPALLSANGVFQGATSVQYSEVVFDDGSKESTYVLCGKDLKMEDDEKPPGGGSKGMMMGMMDYKNKGYML